MNILMVHPHDLYSSLEPWTVRVKKLAVEFANRGHLVKLAYFPLDPKEANREFPDNGIQVIALDRRLGLVRMIRNILRMNTAAGWADIIHFQKCYYYAALPAMIASLLKNKPVHYDWDDWETEIFYYSNPKERIVGEFLNIYEKLIPRVVDTVSVSSDHLRRLALSLGVSRERIVPAPVGADLERFNPQVIEEHKGKIKKKYGINSYLVLYLGQLHGAQYAEIFVHTANLILRSRKDVTFMVIGEGYRLGELRELTRALGIAEHFIFTGHVSHNEIPRYLADADVCVACFEENDITKCKSPLKIVEYLACGKAIVASNVGEVRNMVGGVGVLARPGDTGSLAEGIMVLLGDAKLRESLGKAAAVRSQKKYRWAVTAENILNAYNIALNSKTN
ncbi:MAG: glycosyltransferase family 4 protein [Candidatus Omnitrophica bacterium]|nr:glycosyltransferase family 4 protein [Candidatus Omnitrophota bacterium]